MDIKRYPIPQTRDPFVNVPLSPAGVDPETGEERFWISTWNANAGMLGILMTPSGKHRIYRFEITKGYAGRGAYSSIYIGDETMWLISDTSVIRRLDLRTGKVEDFETGAEQGLVFAGMQYDEESGKLIFFANTYVAKNAALCGVVFDTRACKTVKIFRNFTTSTSSHGGFPNGDGTYTIRFCVVDPSLWRWDPKTDELVHVCDLDKKDNSSFFLTISGEHGRYIPNFGWFDGYTCRTEPKPETDMRWQGRCGSLAYGIKEDAVWCWDITSGKVTKFCDSAAVAAVAAAKDGRVLTFSCYGLLQTYDPSGALILSMQLAADSYGAVDCMTVTDNGKVIGTPFITQRFWVFDENTGEGYDGGRATPGGGQVTRVWNKGGYVYLTSYTQGYLVKFDPAKPANFPENPYVVAKPPTAMRPVADAEDERCLYYASNHHYGHLGCILTKYDTVTGVAKYLDDPVKEQHIVSLYRKGDVLWGGTSWQSDCRSTPEPNRDSYLLKIDPDTLEVVEKYPAPAGVDAVNVYGDTDGGLLIGFSGEKGAAFMCFDPEKALFTEIAPLPGKTQKLIGTGRTCEYILLRDGKIERWTIAPGKTEYAETILEDSNVYNIFFSRANGEPALCAAMKKEFYVIRGFLK